MNCLPLICWALLTGFEVFEVEPRSPDPHFFTCEATGDQVADLGVIDGNNLTIYDQFRAQTSFTKEFAPTATALDIADVDGDGMPELLWLDGALVKRSRLAANAESETLFTMPEPASSSGRLTAQVLVVWRKDEALLAVPLLGSLCLFTLSGELVESTSSDDTSSLHATIGRPFTVWPVHPSVLADSTALEFQVSHSVGVKPAWRGLMDVFGEPGTYVRRGTSRQSRDAADLDAESWPWFPLTADGSLEERVLYAIGEDSNESTLIRIRARKPGPGTALGPLETGPRRAYPGNLVLPETVADFDGDGYGDLLLWDAPRPMPTPDALARALVKESWPLKIRVHLYKPQNHRFDPRAGAHLETQVPVGWLLESGGPLRLPVIDDLNGDGLCDISFATDLGTFSVWLNDGGFQNAPEFVHESDKPLARIVLTAELRKDGPAAICLQAGTRYQVVRAAD